MNPKLLFDVIQASTDPALSYQREVACCWTNEHGPLSVTTQNNPAAVEFGWDDIWPPIRDSGVKPGMVFMFHSHPPGTDRPSGTDKNMLYGWWRALGTKIVFLIALEHGRVNESHCLLSSTNGFDEGFIWDIGDANNSFAELAYHLITGLSRLPRDVPPDDCFQILSLMKMQWSTCALLDLVR